MIVAIEGADGAGKMTQTTLLAEKLGGTRFAFPNYDSPTGEAILRHLKEEWWAAYRGHGGMATWDPGEGDTLDPLVFQCLQIVNRLELLPQITAARAKGPVVFDRFTTSALVYGELDGLDREWLERVNASLPQPDVWIYLDIPIEESFKRRPERRDRYESDRSYLEKVRLEYLKLFESKRSPRFERDRTWAEACARWHVVDGLGTVEQIHERIMNVVGAGK